MPSAKYSCSASPLTFAKGSTTSDGRSGGSGGGGSGAAGAAPPSRNARTGRGKFLRLCSPRSWKGRSSRLPTLSWIAAERQIPPGSASVWRRAATFTPSP